MIDDPTVDNFFGKFIVGYTRKSSNDVRTILRMIHDYKTKETEIDLVRESRLMEKAVIRNKVKKFFSGESKENRLRADIILEHH